MLKSILNIHTDPTPFTAAAAAITMLRLFSESHCLFGLEVDLTLRQSESAASQHAEL